MGVRYLPHDVLYRQKMGFSVPLAEWFRGPLKQKVRDSLLGDSMVDSGFFNMKYVKEIVDHHQSGLRDYSASIWTLMMYDAFQRQVLNAES